MTCPIYVLAILLDECELCHFSAVKRNTFYDHFFDLRNSEDPVPLFPVGGDVPQLGSHYHVLLRPQPQLCQQRGSYFPFR
jgi:hypothetical protein